ncbi:unnamed protein product [Urochloa decumbens]|uniref:BHLH domain-containing protein n=1 Tax=Urochloa decumbens TaxID=240449 RepID=A0ABC9CQQ2_9POAL
MQGGNGYGYGGYGYGYDAGGYGYDAGAYYGYDPAPAAPAYDYGDPLVTQDLPPPAIGAVELQPSEACPKNYVIFDQARTGSCSVTYHPSLAHKLGGGSPPAGSSCDDDGCSPAREEDSEEIDALLQSSEEDDVTSTCSSAAAAAGGTTTRKKDRIKRMVRALKGVVPGGSKMDTPAVLDEAVWYLKSLKLEAATTKKKHAVRGGSDT